MGAVNNLLLGAQSVISYVSPTGAVWPLSGGLSPVLGAQSGVTATKWKGLHAPFKPVVQQGAREDGDDWRDNTFEAAEIDFTVDIYGSTSDEFRQINQRWFDSWSPYAPAGRLIDFTRTTGEWWVPVRLGKEIGDELAFAPAEAQSATYQWVARTDGIPFWRSFDSVSEFLPTAASSTGFFRLLNRGNLPSWPRYLLQGPFTLVTVADAVTGAPVSFGPLAAGQSVLITTKPSVRSVQELTTSTNMYPLLKGRFSTPLPGVGLSPSFANIAVSITGAVPGVSKVTASVTPYRTWPE